MRFQKYRILRADTGAPMLLTKTTKELKIATDQIGTQGGSMKNDIKELLD